MKTIALLLALALALPAYAAEPVLNNRFAASIEPAERFDVGVLAVERHGERGVPMILVPGLASGAWAWQDVVRRFKASHVIYVVTLPGFDGRPAAAGPVFEQARASLRQLIVSKKIDRPVMVGHSLGATLSIALAERDSSLLRGVVAIDGLPVMPGTENAPLAMRAQMAAGIKSRLDAADPGQFPAQQQQYMRGIGVLDTARADELAKLSSRSDPQAVNAIMAEVMAQDLRADLPKIAVPVLLVAPFFEADAVTRGITQPMAKEYYTSLMQGTPKLTVVSIAPSRHFVMFDQPELLAETLSGFIKTL
ncbi:MAG TPA: alpha/beta hydrolase [Telluria sp.]|nr:alpha/beta hydrolase [Telluria sp.]